MAAKKSDLIGMHAKKKYNRLCVKSQRNTKNSSINQIGFHECMDLRFKCEIHTNINAFYISHHFYFPKKNNVKRILTIKNQRKKILAPRRKSNLLFQNYHEQNNNST